MAATGVIQGNKCYPSASAADDAWFSPVLPSFYKSSTGNYQSYFEKIGSNWYATVYRLGPTPGVEQQFLAIIPGRQACDPSEPFFDGLTLGWLVAVVLVAVAGVMMMRRGAR